MTQLTITSYQVLNGDTKDLGADKISVSSEERKQQEEISLKLSCKYHEVITALNTTGNSFNLVGDDNANKKLVINKINPTARPIKNHVIDKTISDL